MQNFTVENARGGTISDRVLEQLIASGHQLQNDIQPTDADLILLLMTAPQIAEELLQRRKSMETIGDLLDLQNVHFLPCPPGDQPATHGLR